MTSYQPGEPSYTAPQDPWSGAPGVASPPTDPMPPPPRGGFTPGVAAPVPPSPPPHVWSQETVVQDPYGGGRGPGGRAGIYVLVAIIVLVLGGAGGYGAWYLITEKVCPGGVPCGGPQATGTEEPDPTTTTSTVPGFQAEAVRQGDCLVNHGTPTEPMMAIEPCDAPGALRVLSITQGEEIPKNDAGKADRASTATPLCEDVEGWDGSYFSWDSTDDAQDYFYCLDNLG